MSNTSEVLEHKFRGLVVQNQRVSLLVNFEYGMFNLNHSVIDFLEIRNTRRTRHFTSLPFMYSCSHNHTIRSVQLHTFPFRKDTFNKIPLLSQLYTKFWICLIRAESILFLHPQKAASVTNNIKLRNAFAADDDSFFCYNIQNLPLPLRLTVSLPNVFLLSFLFSIPFSLI